MAKIYHIKRRRKARCWFHFINLRYNYESQRYIIFHSYLIKQRNLIQQRLYGYPHLISDNKIIICTFSKLPTRTRKNCSIAAVPNSPTFIGSKI